MKCSICGRENSKEDILLVDNKPECIWACYPIINAVKGWLLNLKDRRK